ncbi:MAG: KpsF/GutQ family sugar-phosphate isomerase [Pyrinomonadaceae bacterium]|nr:KpsF/GutQ family sugar-phosphate isomerase [Pyrinomonadaceae bacterium]MBP6211928.1 KpsF/GutQ family sugar-phosphate isomerase [Pyrinomonadaceae bacterium]
MAKTTYERVAEILMIESEAIARVSKNLSEDTVDRAIAILSSAGGKVIVTGVGKSGVIAEKISQTMTSTGTIAVFVHPTDALHGGLGVVAEDDVVIALSNSGETDELLAIMPTLKQRGVAVISIVGNVDSSLARQSDVVLDGSVDKEACPLNLAPTASTTVALAIGDAIAMTLMEAKGLTAKDFAANHPAGRLGKRLTLTVESMMHPSPNIAPNSGWLDVVKAISTFALGAVNVVDEDGRLVGIVTDGDLRRTIERTPPMELSALTAGAMMTGSPISATPEMLAFDALRLMEDRPSQISVLPVASSDGTCVGLLRLHDVVKSGL